MCKRAYATPVRTEAKRQTWASMLMSASSVAMRDRSIISARNRIACMPRVDRAELSIDDDSRDRLRYQMLIRAFAAETALRDYPPPLFHAAAIVVQHRLTAQMLACGASHDSGQLMEYLDEHDNGNDNDGADE